MWIKRKKSTITRFTTLTAKCQKIEKIFLIENHVMGMNAQGIVLESILRYTWIQKAAFIGAIHAVTGNHRSKCSFDIQEDDLIILAVDETNKGKNEQDGSAEADFYKDEEKWIPVQFQKVTMEKFEPNQPGEMSFLRSHYTEKKKRYQLMDGLKPWRKLDPELEAFVGRGVYEGSF